MEEAGDNFLVGLSVMIGITFQLVVGFLWTSFLWLAWNLLTVFVLQPHLTSELATLLGIANLLIWAVVQLAIVLFAARTSKKAASGEGWAFTIVLVIGLATTASWILYHYV